MPLVDMGGVETRAPFRTNSLHFYRPQQSCGQGYVFTRVCHSVHRGGSPGREDPPPAGRTPPRTRQTTPRAGRTPRPGRPPPQDQADHPPAGRPPGPGRPPPPPGKQTAEYGLRATGTHPSGLHSCHTCFWNIPHTLFQNSNQSTVFCRYLMKYQQMYEFLSCILPALQQQCDGHFP